MKNFSHEKTTCTPAQLAAPGLPQAAPYEWFPCDDFTLEIDPESLLPTEDAAPPVVYDHNTLAQLQCLCRNEETRAQMHQWGYLCIHFDELYFYHSDYLGHTEPALSGAEVYQFFYYSPFGESLITQKAEDRGAYNSPYRFNAKELDEETGNYYYGARYYNPKWSLLALSTVEGWLGVDPLAHEYSNTSPYAFTSNNPINNSEIDGRYWLSLADKRKAESITKALAYMEKKYSKDYAKFQSKANKYEANGNFELAYEYRNKAIIAEESSRQMCVSIQDIESIEYSSQTFSFRDADAGLLSNRTYLEASDLVEDGVIIMEGSSYANFVHELVHAHDHLTKNLKVVNGGVQYVDLGDEVRAYTRQFIFDPQSVKNLTNGNQLNDFTDIHHGWVKELKNGNGQTIYGSLPYNDERCVE